MNHHRRSVMVAGHLGISIRVLQGWGLGMGRGVEGRGTCKDGNAVGWDGMDGYGV